MTHHKPKLNGDIADRDDAVISPQLEPPMQEMKQMEIQFNTPAQQAEYLAEQQRAAAIKAEVDRQKEIQRLQQQSKKQPSGNTNIRKLIKSAITRD